MDFVSVRGNLRIKDGGNTVCFWFFMTLFSESALCNVDFI